MADSPLSRDFMEDDGSCALCDCAMRENEPAVFLLTHGPALTICLTCCVESGDAELAAAAA